MANRIELKGLEAHGYHSCLNFECRNDQDFTCDVALQLDSSDAATSDELDDTVNYADITATAHGILTDTPHNLTETVATEIAETMLADDGAHAERGLFPLLHAVEVTIHRPHAPAPLDFDDVAVTTRRSRKKQLV